MILGKGSRDENLSLKVYFFYYSCVCMDREKHIIFLWNYIIRILWNCCNVTVVKHMVLSTVKTFIGGLTAPGHSNKLCKVLVQKLQ